MMRVIELAPEQFEHEARRADVTHTSEASEVCDSLTHRSGQALLERALKRGELLLGELQPRCLTHQPFAQLLRQRRSIATDQFAAGEQSGE
ncbi:hypothetical protein BJG93_16670 [Paraburkholderia sprentiae WSM5005]|uniref:Uncharacterized protein n=1 Tax=Paraburkholderia sprentiae WSM5005 TaxID=754502 RepID=A0A1I9YLJ6_9BURK|nr:hypothetical protein [Paraburkholderia sprentiae]APA87179.1 hypothetical protein BJG93_16670 [Paraburkholderia sprentiae WSM5005]